VWFGRADVSGIRLYLVSPQLVLRHPLLWLYLAAVVFVGTPWRWMGVVR
jgi:hypothetical protein